MRSGASAPARHQTNTPVDRAYVKVRLEEAGRALLALPLPARSRPYGVHSAWPEMLTDAWSAYGWDKAAVRPAPPSKRAIDAMDEALAWLWAVQDKLARRILFARALIHPVRDRHLYSYTRLGNALGLSREAVRRRHQDGLDRIAQALNAGDAPDPALLLGGGRPEV